MCARLSHPLGPNLVHHLWEFHCLQMCFSRYDGSTKEASFSVGLQGIAEEDTERVKLLISQTIDDIIEYAPSPMPTL